MGLFQTLEIFQVLQTLIFFQVSNLKKLSLYYKLEKKNPGAFSEIRV